MYCSEHIIEKVANLAQKDTEPDPPQSTGTMNLHFSPETESVHKTKTSAKMHISKFDEELKS